MMKLTVASFLPDLKPPIGLQQPYQVRDFHVKSLRL